MTGRCLPLYAAAVPRSGTTTGLFTACSRSPHLLASAPPAKNRGKTTNTWLAQVHYKQGWKLWGVCMGSTRVTEGYQEWNKGTTSRSAGFTEITAETT